MDVPEDEDAGLLRTTAAGVLSTDTERSVKRRGSAWEGIHTTLHHMFLGSRLNILLLFFPVVVAAQALRLGKAWAFCFTLLAIIPLAERLGFVTEQLAMHTNSTVGGLMNATFGNATEVIVAVFALRGGLLRVVQMSLLGSILSNMLLVLGSAFLLGGCVFRTQRFNQAAALVNSGLLLMAVMGMLLPAVLYATHTELRDGTSELFLSRFTSILMLIAYGAYLFFQLKSHRELYSEEPTVPSEKQTVQVEMSKRQPLDALESGHLAAPEPSDKRRSAEPDSSEGASMTSGHVTARRLSDVCRESSILTPSQLPFRHASYMMTPDLVPNPLLNPVLNPECSLCCPHGKPLTSQPPGDVTRTAAAPGDVSKAIDDVSKHEDEESVLGFWGSMGWLAAITVLIAVLSDRLVATLQGAAQSLNVSVAFISVIVLPIVGNAAEHASAVMFACRNRLDITLGVAIGSSTQIAMFVTPFCVVLGWIVGQPLDLNFHLFETATLFITVLVVVFLLQDGASNWLKGLLLVFCYLIIGASFFVHRDEIAPVRSKGSNG